jgi:putative NADH-flavin reductase
MKVALIGATGFMGSAILEEFLRRGHSVTAIVRDPSKLPARKGLVVKRGDVLQAHDVEALASKQDALVSAYNAGWKNPNLYKEYMAAVHSIVAGLHKSGVKRLVAVGGSGSLEERPGVQFVDDPNFPAQWKQGALAARDMLNVLRKEGALEWTVLSPPPSVGPGPRTGKYRVGKDQPVTDDEGESQISVEDLAVAIVDEVETPHHVRARFTVGY